MLCSGFDFSQGGSISVSIYDKTQEIRRSGKEWFADIWRHNGWMEEDDGQVWRVELRLKREALHELKLDEVFHGIEDAYELPHLLPLLWAYGVGSPGEIDGWLASNDVIFVDQLSLSHLRAWVSHLQKTPTGLTERLSDTTVRQYGVFTHAFCRWLEHEEILEKRITARFTMPRAEEKFIPTFTPDDVEKLLAACEAGKRYTPLIRRALTARNRAIVSVLIDTGIRRKELVGLRLCDVDRDMRVLLVHRKGNKWQQIPVSYDGFKPLHEYLTKHRPHLASLDGREKARKDDAVFLADDGKPLTTSGVSWLFEKLEKRTGIDDKRVSPHQCRRYMATMQLADGRSPLDVQRQMGHTTLTMTNRYASLTIEQLKRSHEAHSPLRAKQERTNREGIGTGYWEE